MCIEFVHTKLCMYDLFILTILCHNCMCIEVVQELVGGANFAKEEWLIEVVQRLVECAILTEEEWLICLSRHIFVSQLYVY